MRIGGKAKGLTLIEVMVAVALLVLASAGIVQFFLSTLGLSETSGQETIATSHLVSMMEAIKCTSAGSLTTDFPNGTANGTAGNNYSTLVGGYCLTNERITVTYVNLSSNPLEMIVSVRWQDRRGLNRTRYLAIKRAR